MKTLKDIKNNGLNKVLRDTLKKREAGEGGFTLIELLVVIVIIGILAAIAIPAFLNQREKAWEKAVESDLRNLAVQIETDGVDSSGAFDSTRVANVLADFDGTEGVDLVPSVASDGLSFTISGAHKNIDGGTNPIRWYDSRNGGLTDTAPGS